MRNVPLDSVDAVARPCWPSAPTTRRAPCSTPIRTGARVLYGMSGVMEVETDDGAWAIPPYSGVWIPLANPTACGCRV